jgi:hypothetical protein
MGDMMTGHSRCPRCGHEVPFPQSAETDREAVIESMSREIRHLRETVAYLRGSAAGWPGTPAIGSARHTR